MARPTWQGQGCELLYQRERNFLQPEASLALNATEKNSTGILTPDICNSLTQKQVLLFIKCQPGKGNPLNVTEILVAIFAIV